MDATHIHLLLNHFPTAGLILSILVLGYGLMVKLPMVKRIGLTGIFIMAVVAIPVFLSGEGAEESVEHIEGVSHDLIHEHEEAAELAIWLMVGIGLLAAVSFALSKAKMVNAKVMSTITLVASIAVFAFMVKVGNDGGKIRHAEELGIEVSDSGDHDDDDNEEESEHHDDDDH